MQDKKFGHALVVGVERYPRKITRSMNKKKIERKNRMKPFVKYVNYNHLLPTRFLIKEDVEFKNIVSDEKMNAPETRAAMKKELKAMLQAR